MGTLIRGLVAACTLWTSAVMGMTFTLHDPCGGGNSDSCGARILGTGRVEIGDAERLRSAVANWRREGYLGFSGVTLHSPGGSLLGGIQLGMEIRRLKLDTIAESSFTSFTRPAPDYLLKEELVLRQVECHSACVYAFAGGTTRTIDGAIFGVHQFASVKPDAAGESRAQVTGVMLRQYLLEMGVASRLLDIASMVPADRIRRLTKEEIVSLQLDNVAPQPSSWQIQALNDGRPMLRNLKYVSAGKHVVASIASSNTGYVLHVGVIFDRAIHGADRLSQFPEGEMPGFLLRTDRGTLSLSPLTAWTRREAAGNVVSYMAMAVIPQQIQAHVAGTSRFRVTDAIFGHANSDVGVDSDFGADGLASGFQLLERAR